MDHADCITRHLVDVHDLLAAHARGEDVSASELLDEVDALAWRTLAFSQQIHETFGGAPLASGARDSAAWSATA